MKFVFPCQAYEQKAIDYIQEFHEYASQINGTSGLQVFLAMDKTYSDWLSKVMNDIDIANITEDRVPQFCYFYVREDDDRITGMITIRPVLPGNGSGHIGYSIRPTERRKGYGAAMLCDALVVCPLIGLKEIIITCDISNVASAGVAVKCGGVLVAEYYNEIFEANIQSYRIDL